MAKHTVGQYLYHSVKPYYLPITIFAVVICWAVAHGTIEVVREMLSNGDIVLAVVVTIVGGLIIATGLYVYARVTQMIHN